MASIGATEVPDSRSVTTETLVKVCGVGVAKDQSGQSGYGLLSHRAEVVAMVASLWSAMREKLSLGHSVELRERLEPRTVGCMW